MGSLAHETKALASDLYSKLGLNESFKATGSPRLLALLSSLLERTIKKNEKLLETSGKKEVVTVFHGLRAPNLSIQQYMDRIYKYTSCSPACFILAYIYMEKYLQKPDMHLTSLNVHRLLITTVVVAAKFIDDAFFNNAYYAKVGGVSTAEMNRLELKFLFNLDFRLHVSVETFDKYCLLLEKEANGGAYQVERSIQKCGLEGWPSKEEVNTHQATIKRYSCGAI
ncbi:cyclin-P3-1-like [Aristolochia californica]|uniref:cyclin-P3-1-like n=1 Tax=Aristolochia californica TaxID=171875 RepID=UPI0035D6C53F